jgi:hypothetical protein
MAPADILLKVAKSERADVEKTFALYKEIKVFDRVGAIEAPRLEALVKYMREEGDIAAGSTPAKFFDPAIAVGP